jgi:magnesium transporter
MMRVALAMLPEVRQLLQESPEELSALFEEMHDEDVADLLEMLEESEAALVLKALTAEDAAPILERLDDDTQEAMVEELGVESIAPILSEMAADERTDLIEGLPDDLGDTLLESAGAGRSGGRGRGRGARQVAGGQRRRPDDHRLRVGAPSYTVAEVIERIREVGTEAETVYYVYVLGESKPAPRRRVAARSPARPGLQSVAEILTENVITVSPRPTRKRSLA